MLGLDPTDSTAQLRLTARPKDATTVTILSLIDRTKFPQLDGTTVKFRLAKRNNADAPWTDVVKDYDEPSFDQLLEDVAGMTRQVEALGICRTQAQLDALVSLAFNIGPKRLRRSTLVKLIRRGADAAAIRREWMRWVYAGGKRLEGLVRRREWEAARFFASEKDAR